MSTPRELHKQAMKLRIEAGKLDAEAIRLKERERIIKLVEEHTPIEDSYNMESSCHGCDWEWAWGGEENDSHEDHIIRLIKGETNG